MFAVGKLQRANPLPAGEYWLDVIGEPHQIEFAAWSFEHSSIVDVLAVEHFEAVGFPDCDITDAGFDNECSPSRTWVKFRTKAPLPWNAVSLGFPNIIAPGETVETSADTASVPDFSDYCDIGCQAERVAVAAGVILGGTALVILLAKVT